MKPGIIRWPRVDRDLAEHFACIVQDKSEPAERLLQVAEDSFERLPANPSIGMVWHSKRPHLRGIRFYPMPAPYRSYIVFYRELTGGIEVMAILHGARDLNAALRGIVKSGTVVGIAEVRRRVELSKSE